MEPATSTPQLVEVRRDPSGALGTAIRASISRGQELVRWGGTIADEPALEIWRGARRRWSSATSRLLSLEFAAEALEEFARGAAPGTARTWEESLRMEIRATSGAVELLRLLLGTLSD